LFTSAVDAPFLSHRSSQSYTPHALQPLTQVIAPPPFQFETRYRYDANGNLAQADRQAVNANPGPQPVLGQVSAADDWQSTVYAYTTLDQLASVTDDLTHTTSFTYDPNGNQASLTDAKNQPTTYTYDDFDRLTQTTYADTSFEQYAYDAASNLTSRLTPANQQILYVYDALNRLDLKTLPGGLTHDYVYDAGSRLKDIIDSANGTLHVTYDALNRVRSTTDYHLRTIAYTYDGVGNRLSMTATPGGGAPAVHTYTYDPLSQLQSVTGAQTHGYQYDPVGNRQQADGTNYTPNLLNQYSQVGTASSSTAIAT